MAEPAPAPSRSFPIDWGELSPLRLKARTVAEGLFAGAHRSRRRGAGVEFGGHRPYVPGDDLRFFDRRAMLRHERLMIRQFETETDRALWLCIDATASMSYRGTGAASKYAYAAVLAASLARVALTTGDPVGLSWIGGRGDLVRPMPARAGREAFDRVVASLESAEATGDLTADKDAVDRAVLPIVRRARRGSVVVVFTDLLDLPEGAERSIGALAVGGRPLIVVQVLDPREVELDFDEQVRLRALEGDAVIETDPAQVRAAYKERLAQLTNHWTQDVEGRGGRLVRAITNESPVDSVRRIVQAIEVAGT